MKKVAILLLTYNRFKISSSFIPYIINNIGDIDCEIFIWDNGSKDGTYDWLTEYEKIESKITKVFRTKHNFGVEAINFMARYSKSEYILKVDDDIEVPNNFAERLVTVYEKVNDPKLLFLGWDMKWIGTKTFATRSGLKLYKEPLGRSIQLGNKEYARINFNPERWLINGACRLSNREDFLSIGGHPKGYPYGIDYLISKKAAKNGYYIGYYCANDLVIHQGIDEDPAYRRFKDKCIKKLGAPRHL